VAIALLAAVGVGITAATAIATLLQYGALPERIPIHFGISGAADSFGPRWTAWLLVGVQCAVMLTYGSIYAAGAPKNVLVGGVAVLFVFWRAQTAILDAAISGSNRISIRSFLLFIAGVLLAAFLATRIW